MTFCWCKNTRNLSLSYLSCYFMITHLKIMVPFYGWGLTASWLQSYYEEIVYYLPLSSQKFLVYIHLINLGGMKSWVDLETISLCINLVITKHKLKSQYPKLSQLWRLTVNCVEVSSVLSGRLITKLSKTCFLSTHVDQMFM